MLNRILFEDTKLDIRSTEDGKQYICGYAIKYGERSKGKVLTNKGVMYELVKSGAFNRTLDKDIKTFVGHDKEKFLGRTSSGSLTLTSDEIGLKYELLKPNTTLGNDTYEHVMRGDYQGLSIGFKNPKYNFVRTEDGIVAEIEDLELKEVSIVIDPAYDTTIKCRSAEDYYKEDENKEGEDYNYWKIKHYLHKEKI